MNFDTLELSPGTINITTFVYINNATELSFYGWNVDRWEFESPQWALAYSKGKI